MDGSIKLFRVWGIDIRMHPTFPLILVWAALQYGLLQGQGWAGVAFGIVVTLLLFVIVVLHELGHSYAALRYRVPVRRIVLLPIGGVAELEGMPENPRQELVIALAGPAVNGLLAVLLWLVARAVRLGDELLPGPALDLFERGALAGGEAVFRYIFIANLFLGLFNLLPIFPLDGGRVLRALLALRLPYVRATAIAAGIGQAAAWLFGLWGILSGNFFMIILAVFVYMGAGQESRMVQVRGVLAGIRVRQTFTRAALTLAPTDPLRRAVEATLGSFQADFPVCEGERVVGLLTAGDLVKAMRQPPDGITVGEVMRREFPVAAPDEPLFDAQQRMGAAGVDAAPVVEHGRFAGLLTSRDIGELYQLLSVNPLLLGAKSRRPPADAGTEKVIW